jgi:hypothetical protein
MQMADKIIMRPVEALIPYARNARTHSDAQVAQIAGSIREFGFTNPVLLDGDNGIIAGHGRVLAARKLGLVEVPCVGPALRRGEVRELDGEGVDEVALEAHQGANCLSERRGEPPDADGACGGAFARTRGPLMLSPLTGNRAISGASRTVPWCGTTASGGNPYSDVPARR